MLKLAFFKAKHGNFHDKLVAWFSRGPYSHVELVFSDNIAFSSSPEDGGTRFKRINFCDKKYDFINIPCDLEKEKEIRNWCRLECGKNYDWFAIFGYVFGAVIGWAFGCKQCLHDTGHWYCSEVCMAALAKFEVLPIDCDEILVHPNDAFDIVIEKLNKLK